MPDAVADFIDAWWIPAAIVAAGVVIGLIVERIVLVELRRILKRTRFSTPERLVGAVKGASAELVILASAYIAIDRAEVTARIADISRDVLFVLVALVLTNLVARLTGAAVRMYMAKSDGALPASSIFVNIAKALVFVIGFLIIMAHFGISITPIITALGVGGLAVALALQETLSSLFAGLQILAARQFQPGDFIELESGEAGEIIDITWRNTIIQSLPNNEIIVPNSKMASSIVTNYEAPHTDLSVLVPCSVAYDSDLDHVERVACEVAGNVVAELEGEFEEWEPLVRFHTFGDSAIEFTIVLRAREFRDQYELKHQFVKRLKKRFDAEGIEIPFPQRVVHQAGE